MQLIFLGVASALAVKKGYYHSNMLLSNGKKHLLIDCGSDIRFSLYNSGFAYEDITDIFISHLHADHVGGLEWLCLCQKFHSPHPLRANLYINKNLVNNLWEHSLKAGLSSLQDKAADLQSFINLHNIDDSFIWSNIKFELVKTIHYLNDFKIMPSYGLIFRIDNQTIFITTDTQFTPEHLMPYYQMADIIFHDCETGPHRSNLHAHYLDLRFLPTSIKAKMWLYHYNPYYIYDAENDGFKGFINQGQKFTF